MMAPARGICAFVLAYAVAEKSLMSASGKTIAKNLGVVAAAQILTWALAFLLAIFQPRYLGATAVGQLSIATAIWLIAGVLIGFGMDTFLIKSTARTPDRTAILVSTSIILRCLLFIPGSAIVLLYLYLLQFPPEIFYIAGLIGVATFFSIIGSTAIAALTGLERMEYMSLASVASKAILTGVSLFFLFLGFDVYWIAAANILANLTGLLIAGYYLSRICPPRVHFNRADAWAMLRSSSPYLITGSTLIVYQQVDKLFISALATIEAVGWYGAAMNLFGTLMFVPVAVGTALFPTLSRSFVQGHEHLASVARRAFDLMFILSIPIGLGMIVIADPLVNLLYGPAFSPSGDILAFLGLVLIFTYLNTLLGQLLIAAERTARWNVVMIAMTVATLPLDLVLVPWTDRVYGNGALGGAIAFTLTELGMLIGAIWLLPQGMLRWSNIRTVLLSLLAGLLMMAASWWLRESYMILSIIVGAIVYTALVLLFRIVPREDLLLLVDGVRKVLARLPIGKRSAAGLSAD